jgi:leucyl-tRNA synthetase
VLRLYLLFSGPYQEGGVFSDKGVAGISRFVTKVWSRLEELEAPVLRYDPSPEFDAMQHRTIRRVGDDLAALKFHTAIAGLMEHQNFLQDHWATTPSHLRRQALRTTALLLAPLAPHLAEELWERLGEPYSVHNQPWPQWDAEKARPRTITLVVQVNGKVRDKLEAAPDLDEDAARALALGSERVQAMLNGKTVRQTIYVPGKLVNIVVG